MLLTCIVIGCDSHSNRGNVSFYSVPAVLNHRFLKDKNELSIKHRDLWIATIKREDLTESIIKNQRICTTILYQVKLKIQKLSLTVLNCLKRVYIENEFIFRQTCCFRRHKSSC